MPGLKFQNFEPVRTELKFHGKLSKASKAKAKVNDIHRN
jgi:hypothetical protein